MRISKRLEAIAAMVPSTHTIVDVGCDHGLLGILLLTSHKCKHVINTDISIKAIESAKKNAKQCGLESYMDFYRSDGFHLLPCKEEDVVVIAGMGAHTMLSILQNEKKQFHTLILSANKDLAYLRREVVKMGYKIVSETALFDKKWYVIIHFEKGEGTYSEAEYVFGPFARYKKDYMQFIKKKEEMISNKRKQKTDILLLLEKTYNKKA